MTSFNVSTPELLDLYNKMITATVLATNAASREMVFSDRLRTTEYKAAEAAYLAYWAAAEKAQGSSHSEV